MKPENVNFFVEYFLWDENTETFCDDDYKICFRSEHNVKDLIEDDLIVYSFEDKIKKQIKESEDEIKFNKDYFRIDVGYIIHHELNEGGKAVIDKYNEVN